MPTIPASGAVRRASNSRSGFRAPDFDPHIPLMSSLLLLMTDSENHVTSISFPSLPGCCVRRSSSCVCNRCSRRRFVQRPNNNPECNTASLFPNDTLRAITYTSPKRSECCSSFYFFERSCIRRTFSALDPKEEDSLFTASAGTLSCKHFQLGGENGGK